MDPLQQRANERKIFEAIVEVVVDMVYSEFGKELPARLRIYDLIAENFQAMAASFRTLPPETMLQEIENGRC